MSDLINGLRHMADDHPCCRETLQLTIDTIEVLERENAALREKNAEWREMIREAVFDNNDILYWIRGARRVLLSEVEKDHAARAKEAKP